MSAEGVLGPPCEHFVQGCGWDPQERTPSQKPQFSSSQLKWSPLAFSENTTRGVHLPCPLLRVSFLKPPWEKDRVRNFGLLGENSTGRSIHQAELQEETDGTLRLVNGGVFFF